MEVLPKIMSCLSSDLERMMKEDILKQVNGEDAADFRFHIMCVNVWMEMDSTKDIVPCEQPRFLSQPFRVVIFFYFIISSKVESEWLK